MNTHKTSADHDSRYYTESEIDEKFNKINSDFTRMSFFSNDRENCTFPANASEYYRISVPDVLHYLFYPTEIETTDDDSLIFLRYEREPNNIVLYFRNISTLQKTATIHIEGFYAEIK